MATEMGKGPFMGFEKLCQPLIGTGVIEPAVAEAQRQHEHMHDPRTGAKGHQGLASINLTLLPRRRLKPHERPAHLQVHFTQRGHTPLHRLITAGVAAARSQFLVQNPR